MQNTDTTVTTGAMTKTTDHNGESASRGMARNADGTWTALTYTASETFKTEKGARSWLARRGVNV